MIFIGKSENLLTVPLFAETIPIAQVVFNTLFKSLVYPGTLKHMRAEMPKMFSNITPPILSTIAYDEQ